MKKSFGKISFVVILVNLLIFSVYLANQNKEDEKQIVDETVVYATETQTEEEPVVSYSLVGDAIEYDNEEGYKVYRDADVPDEDVEKLLSRLLRLRNVDGAEKFCKAVTWYITTDQAVTTMFAVDEPSRTFMVYDCPEYEIYLEQIAMIVQASARDDSGKEL